MGKCSRNRGKRHEDRDVKHGHGPQAQPWTNPLSQPRPINDALKNFRLSDVLTATPPAQGQTQAPDPGTAGPTGAGAYEPGYGNSRWNSLKAGLRAKILFGAPMQALIDERCRDFAAQLRARSLLDSWLCLEMARASVKIDVAHELLTVNQERVLGRVETSWNEDAAAREDRRARGLQDQPYDVARELGRSKHGTLLLISRWEALGEAVAVNQRLDEAQIQMAYDLLAMPKVLRNGSRQVPAADNAPGLSALVARELARHRANLERSLNASDQCDRAMARLGVVKERGDSVTRGLKADLSRAERRLKWAEEVFQRRSARGWIRTTIIDPDTKAPIKTRLRPTARSTSPGTDTGTRGRRIAASADNAHFTRGSTRGSSASPPRGLSWRKTRRCCASSPRRSESSSGRRVARSRRATSRGRRSPEAKPRNTRQCPRPGSGAPAGPVFGDFPGRRMIDVIAGRAGWIDRASGSDSAVGRACALPRRTRAAKSLRPGTGPSADSFGPPRRRLVVQTDPAGTAGRRPFNGKAGKKEAEFSRKQDDIYGGLVVHTTQNSKFHGTRHQITQIADSASGTVAD